MFTIAMLSSFCFVTWLGHFALTILVRIAVFHACVTSLLLLTSTTRQALVLQLKCFAEIIAIGGAKYRNLNLPWWRTLNWSAGMSGGVGGAHLFSHPPRLLRIAPVAGSFWSPPTFTSTATRWARSCRPWWAPRRRSGSSATTRSSPSPSTAWVPYRTDRLTLLARAIDAHQAPYPKQASAASFSR